jgi:hypothetical protein
LKAKQERLSKVETAKKEKLVAKKVVTSENNYDRVIPDVASKGKKMEKKNIHRGESWNDFKKYFLSPEELVSLEIRTKAFVTKFKAKQEKLAKIEAAKNGKLVAKKVVV